MNAKCGGNVAINHTRPLFVCQKFTSFLSVFVNMVSYRSKKLKPYLFSICEAFATKLFFRLPVVVLMKNGWVLNFLF